MGPQNIDKRAIFTNDIENPIEQTVGKLDGFVDENVNAIFYHFKYKLIKYNLTILYVDMLKTKFLKSKYYHNVLKIITKYIIDFVIMPSSPSAYPSPYPLFFLLSFFFYFLIMKH